MKTIIEQLHALRPGDDAQASVQAAISNIRKKKQEFLESIERLQKVRNESFLEKSGEELLKIDSEIRVLEISVDQADQMIEPLQVKLSQGERQAKIAGYMDRYHELAARKADAASRFHNFYGEMLDEYLLFLTEFETLKNDAASLQSDVAAARNELGPVPHALDHISGEVVCSSYIQRVCLPLANLDISRHVRTPMAHVGKFWQPAYVETAPPHSVTEPTPRTFNLNGPPEVGFVDRFSGNIVRTSLTDESNLIR